MSSTMAIVLVVAVLAVLALIPVILGEFIRAGHPSEDEYELISYGEEADEDDIIKPNGVLVGGHIRFNTDEDDIIKPKRVIDWSQHEDLS